MCPDQILMSSSPIQTRQKVEKVEKVEQVEQVEEVKQVALPSPCWTSKGHTWKQPAPLRCDLWRAAASNQCGSSASLIGCADKLNHLQQVEQ